MALIKCPECGADVSSKARTCPHCGVNLATLRSWKFSRFGCLGLIVFFFLIYAIGSVQRSCSRSPNTETSSAEDPATRWKVVTIPQSDEKPPSPSATPKNSAATRVPGRNVSSLTFSAGTIYIGQPFDNTLKVITVPMVNLKVEGDPRLPGSLQVTKSVAFEGKRLVLVMARERNPGPYVVRSILVE